MGKAEATIVDVYTTDREGKELEMKNGGKYRKFKLSVIDANGNGGYVFDPIFGGDKKKIKQMVDSIGDQSLIDKFNKGTLVDEELFGRDVFCLVGIKEGKEGYDDQNVIDRYLARSFATATETLLNGATASYSPLHAVNVSGIVEQGLGEDIPF
jgi:hypothetical protein